MSLQPVTKNISGTVAADGTCTITVPSILPAYWSMLMVTLQHTVNGQLTGNPSWTMVVGSDPMAFGLGASVELGPRPVPPKTQLVIQMTGGVVGAQVLGVIHGTFTDQSGPDELLHSAYTPAANSISTLTSPAPSPFIAPNQPLLELDTGIVSTNLNQWIIPPPAGGQQLVLFTLQFEGSTTSSTIFQIGIGSSIPAGAASPQTGLLFQVSGNGNPTEYTYGGIVLPVGQGLWLVSNTSGASGRLILTASYSTVPGAVVVATGPPTTVSLVSSIATVDVTDRATRILGSVMTQDGFGNLLSTVGGGDASLQTSLAKTSPAPWQAANQPPKEFSINMSGAGVQHIIPGTPGKTIYLHKIFAVLSAAGAFAGNWQDTSANLVSSDTLQNGGPRSLEFAGAPLQAGAGAGLDFNVSAAGVSFLVGHVAYSLG